MISGKFCNNSFFVWKTNLVAGIDHTSKTLVPFFLLSFCLHLFLFFSWPKASNVTAPPAQIPISFLPAPAAPSRDNAQAAKPAPVPRAPSTPSADSRVPSPERPVPPARSNRPALKSPSPTRATQKQPPLREIKRTAALQDKQVVPPPEPEKPRRREEKIPEPIPREFAKTDLSSRPLPSVKDLLPSAAWSSQRDYTGDQEGPVSLNTREPRYLTYFETVKRAIQQVWEYPEKALRGGLEGKLILEFTILEDGEVVGPRLLHSSGFLELDQEAMRAVRAASPFKPIPASVGRNRIDVLASFEYSDNRPRYRPGR